MIMGRKTFESLGKPLPGRPHIIITRDQNYNLDCLPSCYVVHSVEDIIKISKELVQGNVSDELVLLVVLKSMRSCYLWSSVFI